MSVRQMDFRSGVHKESLGWRYKSGYS
jgi:hypothetical protein